MTIYRNPQTGELWDSETKSYIKQGEDSGKLRGLGLGTRAVASGLASLPLAAGDLVNTGLNQIPGVNLGMPSELMQQGMDTMGLPQAATPQEQLISAVVSGGAGALAGYGGAASMAGRMPSLAPLASYPGMQTMSGMAAGGGSEVARQHDVGPLGQMAAGMAAGMLPGMASALTQTAVGTITDLGRPFVRVGRERIAGRTLLDKADSPAALDIDEKATLGPPTLGQATNDLGLLQTEKIISRMGDQNKVKFGLLRQQQHAAREEAFNNVAGFEDDIAIAKQLREEVTKPMREAALKQQKGPVNDQAIVATIENILASPEGERQVVKSALAPFIERVKGTTSAERLYGIRKDINDKIAGKSDTPTDKFAKAQLMKVRESIDAEIEAVAPGWGEYLKTYAQQSRGIDQLGLLQDVRARVTNPIPTIEGNDIYNVTKLSTLIRTKIKGFDLTPGQKEAVDRIKADLVKTAEPPELRTSGSDTFGNFSSANVLGNFIANERWRNNPAIQTMLRPLNFIYKLPDEAVTEIIANAMVDPKYGELLMRRASDENIRALSQILREYMPRASIGSATGILGANQ